MSKPMRPSLGSWAAVAGALTLVGLATLGPGSTGGSITNTICLFCGIRGAADALVNIVLFTPLGIALARLGWPLRFTVPLGVSISVLVEGVQIFIPGRDSSAGDVVFNTVGTGVGVLLVATAAIWLRPTDRVAERLAFTWSAFAVAVLGFIGYAWAPGLTRSPYYGQWTPELGHLEWYRGSVTASSIDSLDLPPVRLSESPRVRELILRGRPLRITGVGGPPVTGLAPIFSIYDREEREIVLVGLDAHDLVWRYRTRARNLLFDQPDLRLRGAASKIAEGTPFDIRAHRVGETYCLALNGETTCGLGFTIGTGWGLLYVPAYLPPWASASFNVLAIVLIFVPLGFWFRRGARTAVPSGAVVATLILVPLVTPVLTTPLLEWLGGVLGFAIGWWSSRVMGRNRP